VEAGEVGSCAGAWLSVAGSIGCAWLVPEEEVFDTTEGCIGNGEADLGGGVIGIL